MALVLVALAGLMAPGIASADSLLTLGLTPATSTVSWNSTITLTLSISGLTLTSYSDRSLGGYDITLDYDSSYLSVASVTYGSSVSLGNSDAYQSYDSSTAGALYLSEIASGTNSDLHAVQGNGFTIATITFNVLSSTGSTSVSIDSSSDASDGNSNSMTINSTTGATINVVPEPSTYALLVVAVLFAGVGARKRFSRAA